MFRGATKLTLDDKGRLVIPTKYRERLHEHAAGRIVVTIDRDKCLLMYPLPEWELIERKLMALPNLQPEARRLQRLIVGHATELQIDGHGRLLLPAELLVAVVWAECTKFFCPKLDSKKGGRDSVAFFCFHLSKFFMVSSCVFYVRSFVAPDSL